jgi:hypothetical protein
MSDVAANFDTADTNSDSKVKASEARAYVKWLKKNFQNNPLLIVCYPLISK